MSDRTAAERIDAALAWTLTVHVQGLSVWMNRGTHFDVMFPDDRLRRAAHHYVTISGGGYTDRLVDRTLLDFRSIPTLTSPWKPSEVMGWLDLNIEAGSVASDPDAVLSGREMVAALRLPLGNITPMPGELVKGFSMGRVRGLALGYGVTWTGRCFGVQSTDVAWIEWDREPTVCVASLARAPNLLARQETFTVKCLSADDRAKPDAQIALQQELTEAKFLGHLSRAGALPLKAWPKFDPLPPLPQFGETEVEEAHVAKRLGRSARTSARGATGGSANSPASYPAKPCPPGGGAPF